MVTFFSLSLCNSGHCAVPFSSINTHYFPHSLHGCFSLKRCLLSFAALCAVSFSTAQAAQPLTAPVLASDIADRYANLIYYGSGATGMAMVVIDGNQRVFRSFGETRPGNNVHPQLDSVIRIASLTKLMTSEMLVKLLDQGVVKLDDPLSKYAPPAPGFRPIRVRRSG